MATRRKRSTRAYSPEETAKWRADQRQLRIDMLHRAATELLTTEGWQRWVRCRSKMNRYSANNLALILMQCPEATMVAKYRDWRDYGRWVVKGQHPLSIWAPLFRKPTREEIASGADPDRKILYSFKAVGVFDVSQTDGDSLPEPVTEPITGDSHARYLPRLELLAVKLGYAVAYEDTGSSGGWCDYTNQRIVVDATKPANGQVRVLVHEVAHALGLSYKEHGREHAEVLVEAVTFIVCGGLGLDTAGESVPYVAGWGEADHLAAIETFAQLVDQTARTIEAATSDPVHTPTEEAT